ncbi:spore germination protein KC [Neobacillus niacini]|jgi:spore germination protein KC|uniref:Ger(x)C family spore germination protein n=1 Tax=Neobacillus niacini TaxID=86668 RepID=UPI00277EE264|nr:Ger(x)C family spore germination protein [Neobacillus niacini]MDQ1003412.1 spore germination protein KC [Neobacillus niacini]
MKKIISFFIMFLLIISLLTSCWSSKELNEIAIVSAIGIDKTEDGYLVSVQIVNPGEIAGKTATGRTEVIRFMKTGDTLMDAMRRLSTDVPRRIYVAHLRNVVFGEELAKEGIGKVLDVLSRHHEMRSDFFLTVAKGSKASDILNVQTALEKSPATKLSNALETADKRWAPTKSVTVDELITSIVSKGKEPVLTGVHVYGNPESGSSFTNVQNVSPKTGLKIDTIGVFKNDKLIGWLNEEESKGFNYITDNVKSTAVTFPCEDGKITISTIRSKTKVKGKMENGNPKISIQVTTEGDVGEVACEFDLSKPEKIKQLNKKYQNWIKERIELAIKTVQEEYQSDIFGFGEVIHRADPKAWKRLQKNWDQEFAKLEVTVNVKAEIRRLGTITESFQKEIEEK